MLSYCFHYIFYIIIHYRKIIYSINHWFYWVFHWDSKKDAHFWKKFKKKLVFFFEVCRMRIVATARIENLRASDSNEHLQIFSWDTASLKWLNFVLDDLTIFWLTYFDDLHRPNSSSFRSAWETSNIVMVLAVGK